MQKKTSNQSKIQQLRNKRIKLEIVNGKISLRAKKIAPIYELYERGYLNISQFSAGVTLYQCFVDGWGENNSYEIKEIVDGGKKNNEITTRQIQAQEKFNLGKKALVKLKKWEIVNQVVINEIPPTRRGMGGHEIKMMMFHLRVALKELARVYGFI